MWAWLLAVGCGGVEMGSLAMEQAPVAGLTTLTLRGGHLYHDQRGDFDVEATDGTTVTL